MTDSDGRLLSLLIDLNGFKLNLVNIYAPNAVSDCQVFFSHLHDYFLSQGDLVIGGDFNCVDNVLDQLNCSVVPLSDQKLFCSLGADFSLTDICHKLNPCGIVFTWSNNHHMQASRIDHFLVANSLVSKTSCDILPGVLSDHDFVKFGFTVSSSKRGSAVWKFNNSLLSDIEFRNVLSKVIADLKLRIPDFASLRKWWDSLKTEIHAKNALDLNRDSSLINDVESRLSSLILREAEGAKIRSRAQWFQGEKPTLFFSP